MRSGYRVGGRQSHTISSFKYDHLEQKYALVLFISILHSFYFVSSSCYYYFFYTFYFLKQYTKYSRSLPSPSYLRKHWTLLIRIVWTSPPPQHPTPPQPLLPATFAARHSSMELNLRATRKTRSSNDRPKQLSLTLAIPYQSSSHPVRFSIFSWSAYLHAIPLASLNL